MAEFTRFNLKSIEDLNSELKRLDLNLPVSADTSVLGSSISCGGIELPNRFVVQPMEGIDADEAAGAPSELTFRRYRRFAEGGAGLIWFEAAVVEPEGRSNPRQLLINRENLDVWKRLVDQTREAARLRHGHEITTVLQISHSGRWSKPYGKPVPVIVHRNPELDAALKLDGDYPLISDDDVARLRDLHISCGELAVEAGFDGVEMKAVHGYFAGETLCARGRGGRYGGSYENRTRFVRECAEGLVARLGGGGFVTARLTMHEPSAYPYGWGTEESEGSKVLMLDEPLRFASELVELTDMPFINFSIGYPRFAPYMNRPFNNPIAGGSIPPEHPLEGIVRFQQVGRELQKRLGDTPVITAALGWLRHLMPEVAAGLVNEGWVKLIGQGRQSFAYPESPADVMKTGGMDASKCCISCSLCSQIMKDVEGRNGCPVRDGGIYRAELQKGRKAAAAKDLPDE